VRVFLPLLVVVGASVMACTGSLSNNPGTPDGGGYDDASGGGSDGSSSCLGPLGDAGFSTVPELPLASLCTEYLAHSVTSQQCGSWTIVRQVSTDCDSFWLFDTATGALQAIGAGCVGADECTGAVPGFQYPNECLPVNLSGPEQQLCTTPDAGGPDAAADASVD
jgi:hypothetical protein